MTSLVADLLVNPVLRQARRFSLSRSSNPPEPDPPLRVAQPYLHSQEDDVISETEEGSSLRDDPGDSASSRRSSRSSVLLNLHMDVNRVDENCTRLEETRILTNYATSVVDSSASGSQADLSSADNRNMSTPELPSSPSLRSVVQEHSPLPEDDGMGLLRKRILAIQAKEIGHSEKAHLMHQLLIEGYTKSRPQAQPEWPLSPLTPVSPERQASQSHRPLESFKFWQNAFDEAGVSGYFALTNKDLEPTFVPKKEPAESEAGEDDTETDEEKLLGCEHYRRNVKLQCSTCNRWYTCRFCHDKVEDHNLIRKETRNMLCMLCGTAQKAGQACVSCEALAARYYCDICKLWNDDPDKPCYHCSDCGICRIGRGIGKDFYHCKKCCACIAISTQLDHKCIERAIDCDCPICGDYMFTSPKPVCFMKCGHSIHRGCLDEHQKTSYKCPICNKSLLNMESQFRNLDLSIQAQPMPAEFQDARAIVLCHDCSAKSSTMYHWLGLKCGVCQSYNTAQLQIIGLDTEAAEVVEADLVGRGTQVPGLTPSENTDAITTNAAVRSTRRRHSSTVTGPAFVSAAFSSFPPDRLARSVSPIPTPGRSLHASMVGGYFDLEDDEDDGDILGFWSRLPRSIASNDEEDDDDNAAESSDEMTSEEEMEDDEGDESEDNDFELLGHR
ncbi:hypothetical protein F5Y09DRAFT_119783 [Xylaria sp. FL1042]|nr:hypothetical protein F5Y09DRAFT_119783 [Xylaria sp. FL1042]